MLKAIIGLADIWLAFDIFSTTIFIFISYYIFPYIFFKIVRLEIDFDVLVANRSVNREFVFIWEKVIERAVRIFFDHHLVAVFCSHIFLSQNECSSASSKRKRNKDSEKEKIGGENLKKSVR